MSQKELISISQLSLHYEVDLSFFMHLQEYGLIEIQTIERTGYIHKDKISDIERIIRLHLDLDINLEGIDTIFHLLEKIDHLHAELVDVKNRLKMYEE